jgi:hypothetical protein
MGSDSWLNIGGVTASLLGAAIAFWQARSAKNAADVAIATKKVILEKQTIETLSELYHCAQKALSAISKYRSHHGAKNPDARLRGISTKSDSDAVRSLVDAIRTHRSELCAEFSPDLWCQKVTQLLSDFESADRPIDRVYAATRLGESITDMQSTIRSSKRSLL